MIPKQYRVLLGLHITQRKLEFPKKTKRSSVDSYGKEHCVKFLHYHMYAMRAYFYNIPYLVNFPLKYPVSRQFFTSPFSYLVVINYHWKPSLPNTSGRSKLSEEASPEAEGVGTMASRWQSLWGGGRVERPTSVQSQKRNKRDKPSLFIPKW